jgi:hypothetical protein
VTPNFFHLCALATGLLLLAAAPAPLFFSPLGEKVSAGTDAGAVLPVIINGSVAALPKVFHPWLFVSGPTPRRRCA